MSDVVATGARPRIVYIVGEDWFFVSHFLGMAKAAEKAGFDVVVVTRVVAHRAAMEAQGCRVIDAPIKRRAFGPLTSIGALKFYRAVLAAERPAIVHCIALKSILLGGLAARLAGVQALVLAPTGLGFLWTSNGVNSWVGRMAVRLTIKALLLNRRTRCLFENRDNPGELWLDPDDARRCVYVSGAGVSGTQFPAQGAPAATAVRVAVVARMVKSKGIAESVEAIARARAAGHDVCLDLWGTPDPDNPAALSSDELREFSRRPGVVWRGRTSDVAGVWRSSHIAMLLSHSGEGLPRSLVEAAASARPIITTDVPGCRSVVQPGVEGFLVPLGDVAAAAKALGELAQDPALRDRMGQAARRRFEREFVDDVVNARMESLYREFAPPPPRGGARAIR